MSRSEKLLFAFVLLFAAFKTVVFIWAVPKGFDPTDESFLINGYKHWSIYNTFDYFKIMNLFFNTAEVSIKGYRVLRIVLEIFSAVLFTLSFYSWYNFRFKKQGVPSAPLWLFLFCCFLALFQSVIFRMMSYNDVVYLLLSITWSALLISETKKQKAVIILVYVLSGLLTALMFFVKPPAAVIQTILLLTYTISFFGAAEIRKTATVLFSFIAGVLFFLFFYPGLGRSFSLWFENFSALTVIYRDLEYSTASLFQGLLLELGSYLFFFSVPTAIIILLRQSVIKPNSSALLWQMQAIAHVLLVILSARIAEEILAHHSYHRFLHYSILIFAVLVYQWLALRFETFVEVVKMMTSKISNHHVRVLFMVFLFHFVVTGGSVVSFSEMFYIFQTPTLLVLIIPIYSYLRHHQAITQARAILVSLFVLMGLAFVYFNVFHPYGLTGNLCTQTERIILAEPLLLDKPTVKMFEQINTILTKNGFEKGQPIIALDYLCGVGHLAGGFLPGCACYVPGNEKKRTFNCYYLQHIDAQQLSDTTLVLYTNSESLQLLDCITTAPQHYRYSFVDSVFNGYSLNAETKEMLGEKSGFIKIGLLILQS